ncbi:hypothetical protein CANMA_004359 [Candida margitis]|uniref:uncharacterized protein n=1 Tax=Candida margitis TaxID=1775924 RepID=UPI0022264025|nr:uncharacterized protein CANMA_004359 [Candida margitis]KAI5957927.1 hypothetical protein CANMA_004359 [Candida margitis]
MSSRPSTLRHLVRSSQEFVNCLNPLLEESLPVVSPTTKVKTLYLSSFLICTQEPQNAQRVSRCNEPKPRRLKPNRKSPVTRIPHKKVIVNSAVNATDENDVPPIESSDPKEVYLSYNDSNTPKYIGKFFNVMVGNRLKRQCKYCQSQYADLKGFNRHFEKKHGIRTC